MARLKEVLERNSDKLCAQLDEDRRRTFLALKRILEQNDLGDLEHTKAQVDQALCEPSSSEHSRLFRELFAARTAETLRTLVMADLECPTECVMEDLTELAILSFFVTDSGHDEAFRGFVRSAVTTCEESHRSEPFVVGEGMFVISPGSQYYDDLIVDSGFVPITLWKKGAFEIDVVGALPTSKGEWSDTDPPVYLRNLRVFATTSCIASRRAADAFARKIKDVLPSLIKSFSLLSREDPLGLGDESLSRFPGAQLIDEDGKVVESSPLLPDCRNAAFLKLDLPIVQIFDSEGKLDESFLLLPECLNAVLLKLEKPKKDTLDRRIRNAILLLAESDRQMNNGISAALSVTAIEALVGRKTTELSRLISDNVATLLEPIVARREPATSFVKKLYDQRSRILHGEEVEAERQICEQARMLAAAVLKALIERRNFVRRTGMPTESPDQLLQELRRYKEGQPTGVMDSSARRLWESSGG